MEISIRDHLLDTTNTRGLLDENVRSVVCVYLKEKFDQNLKSNVSSEELMELQILSVSLVSQMTSWRNEKKQREKVTNELHEFIQIRISDLPLELQAPPTLEIMAEMTSVAIEAAYKALLSRAGRAFAENALFMMVVLILDFPSWLKAKFDSGELTYNSN
jgi:hypothetical protein